MKMLLKHTPPRCLGRGDPKKGHVGPAYLHHPSSSLQIQGGAHKARSDITAAPPLLHAAITLLYPLLVSLSALIAACGGLSVTVMVAVAAAEFPNQWEFRLAGGGSSSLRGRVEMRPDSASPWGTVCADLFKNNDNGPIAACNSAGLVGVVSAKFTATFGAGTGPIYLTNVNCAAGQTFVQNCSRSALLATGSCVHSEDAGVECTPPAHLWKFKMVNGTAPGNGLVLFQPMPSLPWGTVHFNTFYNDASNLYIFARRAMCRTLGYPNTTRPTQQFAQAMPPGAIDPALPGLMQVTTCNIGSTVMSTCTFTSLGQTSTTWSALTTALVMDCDPPAPYALGPSLEVTLVDGWRYGTGTIYLRPNASLPWGTVFYTSVSPVDTPQDSAPTPDHAAVLLAACRSAGYLNATAPRFAMYSYSLPKDALNMRIDYGSAFNCSNATLLSECTRLDDIRTRDTINAAGSWAAGVDCFPQLYNLDTWQYRLVGGGVRPSRGRLEMRPDSGSQWAGISMDINRNLIELADGVCRTLGYPADGRAVLQPWGTFANPSPSRSFYYLGYFSTCPFNATLQNCTFGPVGSSIGLANRDVSVDCDIPPPAQWEYRLVQVGPKAGTGRVDVRPGPDYAWGYIVNGDYAFPMTKEYMVYTAFALCRKLGFDNATIPLFNRFLGSFGPPMVSGITCRSNDTDISTCPLGGPQRWGFVWQTSGSWVPMGIECITTPFTPVYRFEDGGGVASRGRLMYRYDPNLPYGSVCNDLFKHNHITWNAACRSAGFTNVTSARYQSFGGAAESVPIYLDEINCPSNATFLENCTRAGVGQHNCFHGEDAGVDCFPPPDPIWDWQFRLADGTSATNGRVEMRPSGIMPWGSICAGPYFNHSVAAWEAACRSVGIASPPRARWRYFPKGPETVYLDNVSCTAGAANLTQCNHFPIGSYRCDATEVAGVDCNAPAEVPEQWQFRLVSPNRSATSGRVEMRPSSDVPWGSVCRSAGMLVRGALAAVCRSAGFPTATRPVAYRVPQPPSRMYLDGGGCPPNARDAANCSFMPLYAYNCDPSTDALAVECHPTTTAAVTATATPSLAPPKTATASATPSPTAAHTPSPKPTPTSSSTVTAAASHSRSAPPTRTALKAPTGTVSPTTAITASRTAGPTPDGPPPRSTATHTLVGPVSSTPSGLAQPSASASTSASLSPSPSTAATASGHPKGTPTITVPNEPPVPTTDPATTTETTTVPTTTALTPTSATATTATPICQVTSTATAAAAVTVARGPLSFRAVFAAPVLREGPSLEFPVPTPPALPARLLEGSGLLCHADGPSAVSCGFTVRDEKILLSPTVAELAVPAELLAAPCAAVGATIRLVLLPPPLQADAAAVTLQTAAVLGSRLTVLADPTAYDAMAAVVVVLARCARATDADTARITRYLLSPAMDAGPVVVGALHVGIALLVLGLHCAVVLVKGGGVVNSMKKEARRRGSSISEDALTTTAVAATAADQRQALWAAWRFPGLSAVAALLLYPGAGWAAAELVRSLADGSNSTGSGGGAAAAVLSLTLVFLVAVPCLCVFALVRLDPDATYITVGGPSHNHRHSKQERHDEHAVALTALDDDHDNAAHAASPSSTPASPSWWRRLLLPSGHWAPWHSDRSYGGARGTIINQRGRYVGAAQCVLFVVICALVGAPTQSASCRGQHAASAALVLAATAAAAIIRPFATPVTLLLNLCSGLTLGLLLGLQAADASSAAKDAALVLNAVPGLLCSAHLAWLWVYSRMQSGNSSGSGSANNKGGNRSRR